MIPTSVNIEVTNRCNLACRICWGRNTRPEGFMETALFDKVTGELSRAGVSNVGLHFNGEPTLHPQFPAMIELATYRGLQVRFSTNGMDVPHAVLDAAVSSGVRKVNISIHNKSSAPVLMAKQLHGLRGSRRRPAISAVANWDGQSLAQMRRLFERYAPWVDTFGYSGTIRDMKWAALPPTGCKVVRKSRCQQPLGYAAVLWDGRVTVCCHDLAGELASGNVAERSLAETLDEPHFADMRWQLHKSATPDRPLCRRCGLWRVRRSFASCGIKGKWVC